MGSQSGSVGADTNALTTSVHGSTTLTLSHTQRPWKLWRANFYRYGYPGGAEAPYNLSAWSPTREGSFHVPEKFGVVVLDDEVGHADGDR